MNILDLISASPRTVPKTRSPSMTPLAESERTVDTVGTTPSKVMIGCELLLSLRSGRTGQNPANAHHSVNYVAGSPPETPHETCYLGFTFDECFAGTAETLTTNGRP